MGDAVMGEGKAGAIVLVVGLGAMGAATLHQLAKRGVSAIGFDRWRPPHALGSSHGESRVTRAGVGEGEAYAPLVSRSHEIWRELEIATGARLMSTCGMLMIEGPRAGPIHGRSGFLARTERVARAFGVAHERLDAAEIGYRYPQFTLRGDERGYFEPGGGAVFPEGCIEAQLTVAQRLGARIVADTEVIAVEERDSHVEVRTRQRSWSGDAVVVTAGAWTPRLLGGALGPLRLQPQALHWFASDRPADYAPERFPTFMWVHGPEPEDAFYGFPTFPELPTAGVKVATETTRSIPDPEALERPPPPALAADMYATHVRDRLKGVGPDVLRSAACLYTTAPDGDFVIGRPDARSRTWAVSACSGHGFKHSAALGELVARHALGEADAPLPAVFAPGRAALRVPEPT